jgi:hypothetical protein
MTPLGTLRFRLFDVARTRARTRGRPSSGDFPSGDLEELQRRAR